MTNEKNEICTCTGKMRGMRQNCLCRFEYASIHRIVPDVEMLVPGSLAVVLIFPSSVSSEMRYGSELKQQLETLLRSKDNASLNDGVLLSNVMSSTYKN